MHTFSPAKMWIAGLAALQKPLLHLHTQFNRELPWAEIDMDFMNLNQSAHGDREFGFIETRMGLRRKTVVGHWRDPGVATRIGAWARAAAGWREAQPLAVARFGDNMRAGRGHRGRQGRGADPARRRRQRATASDDLVEPVERRVRRRGRPARAASTRRQYELAPALRAGGERRESLRDAARIEAGLRGVPRRRRRSGRSPTPSRTCTG